MSGITPMFLPALIACSSFGCGDDSTGPEKNPPPTPGTHLWSVRFGDGDQQYAKAVAVDASGNVFIAGGFNGSVDFSGGPLTSAVSEDVFIAKFES